MTVVWVVLGALGGMAAVAIGSSLAEDAFDSLLGRRADQVRVLIWWLLTVAAAIATGWLAWTHGNQNGAVGLAVAGTVLLALVAGTQSWSFWSTHDRRPRTHDPRRTQPDRD